MIRMLFAAIAACTFLAAPAPASAATDYAAPFEIAAKAKADDKKAVTGKSVVRMNTKTKVFHVKNCEWYSGKNTERMSAAEAKKDGGKPCKMCISKK